MLSAAMHIHRRREERETESEAWVPMRSQSQKELRGRMRGITPRVKRLECHGAFARFGTRTQHTKVRRGREWRHSGTVLLVVTSDV